MVPVFVADKVTFAIFSTKINSKRWVHASKTRRTEEEYKTIFHDLHHKKTSFTEKPGETIRNTFRPLLKLQTVSLPQWGPIYTELMLRYNDINTSFNYPWSVVKQDPSKNDDFFLISRSHRKLFLCLSWTSRFRKQPYSHSLRSDYN